MERNEGARGSVENFVETFNLRETLVAAQV